MGISIKAKGTTLPSPTAISAGDEIIWSSDTGRDESGDMVGAVVATKKTFSIEWGVLTEAQFATLRTTLTSGFFTFQLVTDSTTTTITVYRGTLTGELLGTFGGVTYYKNAAATVIQQ